MKIFHSSLEPRRMDLILTKAQRGGAGEERSDEFFEGEFGDRFAIGAVGSVLGI